MRGDLENLSPTQLLSRLAAAGVQAYAAGSSLHLRPASRVPSELIGPLRENKADLLQLVPAGAAQAGRWQLRVVRHEMVPGPVQLNCCTRIIDTGLCAEQALADLKIAVAHKNAGRETAFTSLVEEYIAVLEACGIAAVVEVAH